MQCMPKLSLSMIVRNEAATLCHCLASVKDLVDEMIVVDTGSTDNTREIAGSFGAHVHAFSWVDDFSAARNESLKHCTGDWVLVLDADEAIDALDHTIIRQAIDHEEHAAFRLTLRDYFSSGNQATIGIPATLNQSHYTEGRGFSHYSDFNGLRLCKRLPDLAFQGRIHELLDPFFEARHLQIGGLPAVIHHYGKVFKDREDFKRSYYLKLAQEEAEKHPEDFQTQFNLLIQAMAASEWELVHACAQKCLAQPKAPLVVYLGEAIALNVLEKPHESLQYSDQILKFQPGNAMALVQKAISLSATGKHDEARGILRKAIVSQPSFSGSYINLADLERAAGKAHAARAALEEGLRLCPRDPALWESLVRLSIVQADMAQAVLDAQNALKACPGGGQGLWHRLIALDLAQRGQKEIALRLLAIGLQCFPENTELTRTRALVSGENHG